MPGTPPLVRLHDLRKQFPGAPGPALDGVSLDIAAGSIFGVTGRSGAGKSTPARCVNLLERPGGGSVMVDGQDLTALDGPALGAARRSIGMVFQHFSLLSSRTVAANIALPLEVAGMPARGRAARARQPPPPAAARRGDRVAVLERGQVIELGRVFDVFTRPHSGTARRFVGEVVGGEPFGLMALAAYGPADTVAGAAPWMQSLGLTVDDLPA